MNNIWHGIQPTRVTPKDFIGVIEISKGSKMKYELDKETGLLMLDRVLYISTHYPANYGFIPRTYGDDLDPLDALVLCSEPFAPRTLLKCFPFGVICTVDKGRNDEINIAIPSVIRLIISFIVLMNFLSMCLMKWHTLFRLQGIEKNGC